MKKEKKATKESNKKANNRKLTQEMHVVEPGKVPKVMSNLLKTAKTLGEMQKKSEKIQN